MENSKEEIEAVQKKKNDDEKCEEADGGNGRSEGDSEKKGVFLMIMTCTLGNCKLWKQQESTQLVVSLILFSKAAHQK